MAENESLDLSGRHSKRWRDLNDDFQRGLRTELLATRTTRNLVAVLRKLVKDPGFPFTEMIQLALLGDREALDRIVRPVRAHHDYARQFRVVAIVPNSEANPVLRFLESIFETFMDQIRLESPSLHEMDARIGQVRTRLAPTLAALAQQLTDDPTKAPPMPSRSSAERASAQHDLLSRSLLAAPVAQVGGLL